MPAAPAPYIVTTFIQETPKIFSLVLSPKQGTPWLFKPGQFAMLHLPQHSDLFVSHHPRAYSIASLPGESSILVTAKVHGPFTTAMSQLHEGNEIGVTGPFGAFMIPPSHTGDIVFLAAGVGATPFRPMIEHYCAAHPDERVTLFLSIPSAEEYLYRTVWEEFASRFPNFRLIVTFTKVPPTDWSGETSRIDNQMITRHLTDPLAPFYYLCGPPAFVEDSEMHLKNLGVPPLQIKKEKFITPKYSAPNIQN